MAEPSGNISPETAKLLAEIEKKLKNTNQELSKSQKLTGSLGSAFLGISDSDFFKKITKSTEDIASLKQEAIEIGGVINDLGPSIDKSFVNAFKKSKISVSEINESLMKSKDISKEMGAEILKAVQSGKFSELSSDAMKEFKKVVEDKKGFKAIENFYKSKDVKEIQGFKDRMKEINQEFDDVGKNAISISQVIKSAFTDKIFANFSPKAIIREIVTFDDTLSKAQRKFDIGFKNNSAGMADLTSKTAAFGMSLGETADVMGQLSSVMRTTNFDVLSQAALDTSAISKATGLSAEEAGNLVGEYGKMGVSSKKVSDASLKTMQQANAFGVSGAKVMKTIADYAPKFRQMGFQGGIESLSKMALMAEHLGQNVDELFDFSKRARGLEGAVEIATDLQNLGGSFAQISSIDILSAARKGPGELQKILGRMGSDIGKFDEKTGELKFDPVDIDRLQVVADSTGVSLESLQNTITKTKQDANKLKFAPGSLMGNLSDEEKAFLAGNIGNDGKLTVAVDGISDLSRLTGTNIKNAIESANKEKQNLEQIATENTSFTESLSNLKTTIMNAFVVFEPAIKWLTTQLQSFVMWISKLPSELKVGIMIGVGAIALLFGAAKQYASGLIFGKGVNDSMKGGGIFSGIKNMFKGGKGGAIPTPAGSEKLSGAGPGGWLSGLARGLKSFANPKILMGAGILSLSSLMIGASLIAITAGIAKFGGDASGGQLLTFGVTLVGFAGALFLMSKIMQGIKLGSILEASIAIGIMGLAFIPLAYAMQQFETVSWESLGKAATAIIGGALLLSGLSFLAAPILIGSLSLGVAGLALMAFGYSLSLTADGFNAMSKVDWNSFGNMGTALLTVIPGLALLGGVGLFALPGIIGLSFVLGGFASVMTILAPALSLAGESSMKMAEGIEKLKAAVNGLDTSKLSEIADASERFATSSAISALAGAVNNFVGGGDKEEKSSQQTIKIEPIEIKLMLDGRQLQSIIIKDVKYLS